MMDQSKDKGFLLQAGEDSVQLLPTAMKISANTLKNPGALSRQWTVPATSIQTMTLHRKDATVRGTLIGLVAGVAAGWLIGYAQGDDPVYAYPDDADLGTILGVGISNMWASTAEEKAAGGAVAGALLGAGGGAIIGAISGKTIEIGGSRKAYKAELETMRKRALIH
jgi:hypothetical protein